MYAEFAFLNHIGNASDNAIDLPEPASDDKLLISELEVSDIDVELHSRHLVIHVYSTIVNSAMLPIQLGIILYIL